MYVVVMTFLATVFKMVGQHDGFWCTLLIFKIIIQSFGEWITLVEDVITHQRIYS